MPSIEVVLSQFHSLELDHAELVFQLKQLGHQQFSRW